MFTGEDTLDRLGESCLLGRTRWTTWVSNVYWGGYVGPPGSDRETCLQSLICWRVNRLMCFIAIESNNKNKLTLIKILDFFFFTYQFK